MLRESEFWQIVTAAEAHARAKVYAEDAAERAERYDESSTRKMAFANIEKWETTAAQRFKELVRLRERFCHGTYHYLEYYEVDSSR